MENITKEEMELLKQWRGAKAEAARLGENPDNLRHAWIKTKAEDGKPGHSLFVKFPASNGESLESRILDIVSRKAIKPKKYKRTAIKTGEPAMLVVNPSDIHIGKLCVGANGETYNPDIAVKRVVEAIREIEHYTFNIDVERVLFIGGNDILHTEDGRSTTKGTPQDTSGTWESNFDTAYLLYVELLGRLRHIAPVHYIHVPSNHDHKTGVSLSKVVQAHFRKYTDIEFDVNLSPRKYYAYGRHLLGFDHGDGVKDTSAGQVFMDECTELELTKANQARFFYRGHLHHPIVKQYGSVLVHYVGSPSESDDWHLSKGYTSPACFSLFTHYRNDKRRREEMIYF